MVTVEVTPGDAGEKPSVTIKPETAYVDVSNNAKTVAAGTEEDLTFNRIHGKNTITIEGTIAAESDNVKEWMAVWEPTGYVLDLFRQSLEKQGITWTGEVKTGQAPDKQHVLYTHEALHLSGLVAGFMKLSNNRHGGVLVKEMGKVVHDEGSWQKGLGVVEPELRYLGLNTLTLTIRDGSGISHMN